MQDVLQGIEYRMGYDIQADHVAPIDALVTLLDCIRKDAEIVATSWKPTSYGKLVRSYIWSRWRHWRVMKISTWIWLN